MGLTGVAIDAATALLSSIMIGVGVDFTIQYLWRYNSELRKGVTRKEAICDNLPDNRKKHCHQCAERDGGFLSHLLLRVPVNKIFRLPDPAGNGLMP